MKYAGANWLIQLGRLDRSSTLGIKVANVLGQVFSGIYHIDNTVLKKKVRWNDPSCVSVTVYAGLASFDGDYLTRLALCCQAAGIEVSINGSFKGYTKLIFSPQQKAFAKSPGGNSSQAVLDDFLLSFIKRFAMGQYQSLDHVECSISPVDWNILQQLIHECHKYAVRVELRGRSPSSLSAVISQRKREGGMHERHLGYAVHKKQLASIVNIDYSQLN